MATPPDTVGRRLPQLPRMPPARHRRLNGERPARASSGGALYPEPELAAPIWTPKTLVHRAECEADAASWCSCS